MTLAATRKQFGSADAKAALPRRSAGSHKWGVGGLLIFAGSPGFTGAAALCAMAAGRAGAGIVNLAVSRGLITSLTTLVPEAAYLILPEGDIGSSGKRLFDAIGERAERNAAFLIGPGIGHDDYATHLVQTLFGLKPATGSTSFGFGSSIGSTNDAPVLPSILDYDKPIVVDADALTVLSRIPDWWSPIPAGRLLLTPHVGEMARLLDRPTDEISADPDTAIVEAANRFRQFVLLKGNPTLVSDGMTTYAASDSPASLATAGSGDVLAGSIGALLAQGLEPMTAANLAVYAGVQAARELEKDLGTLGLIASDLPKAIARQLAILERG